jgi:hypothetical protein
MRSLLLVPVLLAAFLSAPAHAGSGRLSPAAKAAARAKIQSSAWAFMRTLPSMGYGIPVVNPGVRVTFADAGRSPSAQAYITGQGKKVRRIEFNAAFGVQAAPGGASVKLKTPGWKAFGR